MKLKLLAAIAGGLLAGLVSGTASAAVIVKSCPTATEISGGGSAEPVSTCQPRPDDPSLGTLTAITFSVSATYSGTRTFVNVGQEVATRTAATAFMDVMVADAFELYLGASSPDAIPEATLAPGQSLVVPISGTMTATGALDPATFEWLPGEPFGLAGLFEAQGVPDIGSCVFPNPTICIIEDEPSFTASVSGTFTYTYEDAGTPVPEPGTLALLGLGLAGLAATRRRKQ